MSITTAVNDLSATFTGQLLQPADAGYDEARKEKAMAQSRIERMLNEARITSYGKLAALTLVAAGAAAIVTTTSLTSSELTAADRDTAPVLDASSSSSYFPSQYVNQATEASEHIQAF